MTVRVRHWSKLKYRDPARILSGLRKVEASVPLHSLPDDLRTLRRRDVRKYGEGRQAALFCHGLHSLWNVKIHFAMVEESDYDFVAAYQTGTVNNFVPVQLKELVPLELNPRADLQRELDKVAKYSDSKDLVVAFYLNTTQRVEFSRLRLPHGKVRELWFFGATIPDQSTWVLIGNMLGSNPVVHRFRYPDA